MIFASRHDKWLDIDNPSTNEEEISIEEIAEFQLDLRIELEKLINEYENFGLDEEDILDVFKEFV